LNEKKLQELIDLIHKVTVLMYHIVFYLIGYRGKFTDYSSLGFPEKTYPSAAPAATGSVGGVSPSDLSTE
jgi:hypothetical protein